MAGGVLAGYRVSLKPIRERDVAAIEPWLDEALVAAGSPHLRSLSRGAGEGRSVDPRLSGVFVIERIGEDEPVGLVEYESKDGSLTVRFIALAKAYRGWGYGSEAVRRMEEWAACEGVANRFLTEVPVGNGLGLYFWLRLGYRPEGPEDDRGWRTERERDRMRMVRYADGEDVRHKG